jgi:hypothetical protein
MMKVEEEQAEDEDEEEGEEGDGVVDKAESQGEPKRGAKMFSPRRESEHGKDVGKQQPQQQEQRLHQVSPSICFNL